MIKWFKILVLLTGLAGFAYLYNSMKDEGRNTTPVTVIAVIFILIMMVWVERKKN